MASRPRHLLVALVAGVVLALVAPIGATAIESSSSLRTGSPARFGDRMYVEQATDAAEQAAMLRAAGRTTDAALIDQIASQPTAIWLGDWFSDSLMKSVIARHVAAARQQGAKLVFVTYAIPNRDCGGYSAGGHTAERYLDWNRTIANALYGTGAVVLVEPDSLAMLSSAKCAGEASRRLPLISTAVDILRGAGLATYLDGGNSRWLTPAAQADVLSKAGVAKATGFFTNVANFNPVQVERDYAGKVSSRIGYKHFVIDISRNGAGWQGSWCNPAGAALGADPHATAGSG